MSSSCGLGDHLVPEEFHRRLTESFESQRSDVLLLDCRNYYESRIVFNHLPCRLQLLDLLLVYMC